MKLLVTGGRGCTDKALVFDRLDDLHLAVAITLIIEGGQRTYKDGKIVGGVDYFAWLWAETNGVPSKTVPADWDNLNTWPVKIKYRGNGQAYNALAGFARNQDMLDQEKPHRVIAFPGGPGTADMVARARLAGYDPIIVKPRGLLL